MRFEITEPCEEPWESMEPRDGGRYCGRCEKVVIDLARMTRREAERRIAAMDADEVCVQLAVDRFGDAVFVRPPPSRAPHWAAGLVLVSALSASAGCATSEPGCVAKNVEVTADPGPPMMPTVLASVAPSQPVTGPVPSDELVDPTADEAHPTAEQRALTAAKHRPPPILHMRGRMPMRHPTGNLGL